MTHKPIRICLYCARYEGESIPNTPLGLGYIASYLRVNHMIGDDQLWIVDTLEQAVAVNPDILGISANSQVIEQARFFARACKERTNCLAVLGGYHVTCIPERMPEEFDIGVLGEGEATFADIISRFQSGTLDTELDQIPGICYREHDQIILNKRRPLAQDLDALPEPYRIHVDPLEIPVFTSRGCPYQCVFCASHHFWGDRYRLRSADSVIREIEMLVERYQPECINILDDLWMSDKERFKDIVFGLVERNIPETVSFMGFCRSNLMGEDEIVLLKKMNYRTIRFGAETGSDALLKRIKGASVSIEDHQRVIDLCHKHRLPCSASFMFGIPGETRDDLKQTEAFLHRNRKKLMVSGFYLFNPIPGTEIWAQLKANQIIDEGIDFSNMMLDIQNKAFSWDRAAYFNEDLVPRRELREFVERIQRDHLAQPMNPGVRCFEWIKRIAGPTWSPRLARVYHFLRWRFSYDRSPVRKLDFGCGAQTPPSGYDGVDIRPFPWVRFVCPAWEIDRYIPENTIEAIRCRHFLEHITYPQADILLDAWQRILKSGATVHISVPDMDYHVRQFQHQDPTTPSATNPLWSVRQHALAGFWGWQREGERHDWDTHKSGYDFGLLSDTLNAHGYRDIERIPDLPWNLNVRCRKQ